MVGCPLLKTSFRMKISSATGLSGIDMWILKRTILCDWWIILQLPAVIVAPLATAAPRDVLSNVVVPEYGCWQRGGGHRVYPISYVGCQARGYTQRRGNNKTQRARSFYFLGEVLEQRTQVMRWVKRQVVQVCLSWSTGVDVTACRLVTRHLPTAYLSESLFPKTQFWRGQFLGE